MPRNFFHLIKRNLLFLLFILLFPFANAEAQDSISHYLSGHTYVFNGLDKYLKDGFVSTYHSQLGLTADDELIEDDCVTREDGKFDCRYRHYHKSYLVEGSSFTLHGHHGVVLYASGNQVQGLNVNVSNPITEASALTAALNYLGATTYAWEDAELEYNRKEFFDDSTETYYPEGTLVISIPLGNSFTADNFKLAWKFLIEAIEPDRISRYVYVDALSGNVISSYDSEDYGQYGTGDCLTEYNGWQQIRTYKKTIGSNWILESDKGITTGDPDGKAYPKDSDNNWHAWEERPWTSTHWATERTWQYYLDRFGIWGSDNKGRHLANLVGWDESLALGPGEFASASEDKGRDRIKVARRQSNVTPAALDILAHEYTHCHILQSAKLNKIHNTFSDAGALNEGFADIFGILAERWIKGNTTPDWTIGEDVGSPFPNPSVRHFGNPHASTHPQAAKYQESGYWDFSDAPGWKYHNAGPLTHWFYLLSNGGSYNGYGVPAIGWQSAEELAHITMRWWLWHDVDYPETRYQSLLVAEDLWGWCSIKHIAVADAWAAVNVGGPLSGCPALAYIKAPKVINAGFQVLPAIVVVPRGDEEISPIWRVPDDWTGTLSADGKTYTLNSFTDFSSKEIFVDFTVGGEQYTLSHIIHFVGEEEEKQSNSGNGSGERLIKLKTISNLDNINIYPNPVQNGKVTVTIPSASKNGLAEIIDITGALIKTVKLNAGANQINTDEIKAGLYFFKIKVDAKQKIHKVVIN